jgi:hypothetical protein
MHLIWVRGKQKYFCKRGWTVKLAKHELICPSGKISRLFRRSWKSEGGRRNPPLSPVNGGLRVDNPPFALDGGWPPRAEHAVALFMGTAIKWEMHNGICP